MTETREWSRARPTVLRPEEYTIQRYRHTVPPETTLEAMACPGFWAHVARGLKPQDEIVVSAEDGTWRAELVVRWVHRVAAGVSVLSYKNFAEEEAGAPPEDAESPFSIGWGGPVHKWRVVRKSDGEVMRKGFDTREQAGQWVKNHQAAQAA